MAKKDLNVIVKNITKQIESNSGLRNELNTFKHEYSVSSAELFLEAKYQLGDLIKTIGSPSVTEVKRRLTVLKTLVDEYVAGLYDAFKAYKGSAKIVFRRGSDRNSFIILVTGGLTAKGNKTDVFGVINNKRTSKLLPQLRANILEQVFISYKEENLDRALYGAKTVDEATGRETRSGGLFQLGHEKQGSISVRRKAEILRSLSTKQGAREILSGTSLSKEIQASIVLSVNTYAKGEAGALLKEFTSILKVNEESARRNQSDSSKEKRFLNNLKNEVRHYLLNELDLFNAKSSSSAADIFISRVEEPLVKMGAKVSRKKKVKSSKTSSDSGKVYGRVTSSSSKESMKGSPIQLPMDQTKDISSSRTRSEASRNWSSLLPIINIKLPEKVANNMRSPRLNFRTGKLASSAEVVAIETTRQGYPSFVFDYERDPYDVFDRIKGRSPWNTPERDPRNLVDVSLREILRELAVERFYTRRA